MRVLRFLKNQMMISNFKSSFFVLFLLVVLISCKPPVDKGPVLPGIAAVDIYGNFEGSGSFQKEKTRFQGVTKYTLTERMPMHMFQVESYSVGETKVHRISATCQIYLANVNLNTSCKQFIGYVASVPIDGINAYEVRNWVESSVGTNASKVFNGVEYKLTNRGTTVIFEIKPVEK